MADARFEENHSEIKKICGTMPVKVKPTATTMPKQMYNCQSADTWLLRKSPITRMKQPAMEIVLVPYRSKRWPTTGDRSASTTSTMEKIPAVAPRLQPKVSSKATLKTPKEE